jgi:hypothetical protein
MGLYIGEMWYRIHLEPILCGRCAKLPGKIKVKKKCRVLIIREWGNEEYFIEYLRNRFYVGIILNTLKL